MVGDLEGGAKVLKRIEAALSLGWVDGAGLECERNRAPLLERPQGDEKNKAVLPSGKPDQQTVSLAYQSEFVDRLSDFPPAVS
jgi:hypothetical protein